MTRPDHHDEVTSAHAGGQQADRGDQQRDAQQTVAHPVREPPHDRETPLPAQTAGAANGDDRQAPAPRCRRRRPPPQPERAGPIMAR
jgi:hypothetical protein